MRKTAKYDNPAWIFLPGHRLIAGKNPDITKFPQLSKNDDLNTTLWGTIGAMASTGALAALLTSLANKNAKKSMNELREKIRKNKISALSAISVPDEAYDEELEKQASADWTTTAIPIGAALATGALVHRAVGEKSQKQYEDELDAEIEAQRKKLNKLYARVLKLYGSGNNFQLSKAASADDNPNLISRVGNGAVLTLLAAGVIPALAAYYYTKKHSDERATEKVLKDQVLASNLTNIPDSILLQLDPHIKNRDA